MQDEDDFFEEEIEYVSKSQMKREMTELQRIGVELTKLKDEQLATIPLDETLLEAIKLAQNTKKREALRRQHQYIGKLMRKVDFEAIVVAYEKLQADLRQEAQQLHLVENWRDRLLKDQNALKQFIEKFPNVERQPLRQLINAANKEHREKKTPANSRKLFRFIRETISTHRN